jgi:hypothetical protein
VSSASAICSGFPQRHVYFSERLVIQLFMSDAKYKSLSRAKPDLLINILPRQLLDAQVRIIPFLEGLRTLARGRG